MKPGRPLNHKRAKWLAWCEDDVISYFKLDRNGQLPKHFNAHHSRNRSPIVDPISPEQAGPIDPSEQFKSPPATNSEAKSDVVSSKYGEYPNQITNVGAFDIDITLNFL